MAWEDRDYYRNKSGSVRNPLMWLWTGSVPLFTAFDVRVRAHASMIVYTVGVLLFGLGQGFTWQDRVQNVTVLFAIVLLHEFGHIFACRMAGGSAHDILMHPLGGLAMSSPPRRPLPTFITVAGGPAVNVLICIVCGAILYALSGWVPWNPFNFTKPIRDFHSWFDVWRYTYWIYQISWTLLIFNLLPIFPLDGGQMLQTMLWPKFGYFRSMIFSCNAGMVCAVVGAMVALATRNLSLAILAILGFTFCMNLRRATIANGPEGLGDGIDYSAAYEIDPAARKRSSQRSAHRAARRAAKLAKQEADERQHIDAILSKVSAHGMQSLTWWEKRTLHKATEHQRQRDFQLSQIRRGR